MPDERLYAEDEIRAIFAEASSERSSVMRAVDRGGTMSLAQLQEIGSEVGIPPERILEAARAVDWIRPAMRPLGLPLAVRRSVPLPRPPTDAEWQILVSELREIFDARGHVAVAGGIFEWGNGNLRVFVEPTMTGYRLRMGTRKGSAVALGAAGLVGTAWGAAAFAGLSLTGELAEAFPAVAIVLALGLGSLAAATFRLPGWARTRGHQMEQFARRTLALLEEETNSSPGRIKG